VHASLEFQDAAMRFAADLDAAGVLPARASSVVRRYLDALQHPSAATWSAAYVALFAALETAGERPLPGAARARLLRLLDDDLGVTLLTPAQRERVRGRLVEAA
jgi:hypothetical protein